LIPAGVARSAYLQQHEFVIAVPKEIALSLTKVNQITNQNTQFSILFLLPQTQVCKVNTNEQILAIASGIGNNFVPVPCRTC
jgi:hypothetical protein